MVKIRKDTKSKNGSQIFVTKIELCCPIVWEYKWKKDLQKWFDYGFIVWYLFAFCSLKQFSNFSLGHSISIDCDNHIPAVKNY